MIATAKDSSALGFSPKQSVISDFIKGGSRQGVRASTKNSHIENDKEKVMLDKKAYKELINYIAKADSKRLDSDRVSHIINLYADSHPVKLKPN